MMRPDPTVHKSIRLADYAPYPFSLDAVALHFDLRGTETEVEATLSFSRQSAGDLLLDGRGLTLLSASIDGKALDLEALAISGETLTVPSEMLPDTPFEWRARVRIDPTTNKALEGLYTSGGMYCTQCEAQGFRKITYFPDRPDVMSVYTVRVEADAATHPVLLSNGMQTASGALADGRHFSEWHDPHPKPCYLFALVAGDLVSHDDSFTTGSGTEVALRLFVRPGDEDKCAYAMDALKRSMRWDETAYGLEYDLPIFMIVAVDDFNMGAMENKGLNIFNTRLVLASPETATDASYEAVESVIAHEYFHNWTGNRITCRDWFQLCLKEGLTVFRDQQFSADMRSAPVQRIKDVLALRGRQFREDSGPLAHPVRPEEYIEINNFYTATVYEKGAEVVRMLHTLVGPEMYRKSLDLYFERHDGQACTVEDFARCFEDATGRDFSQFRLWWSQAGTPKVGVDMTRADDGTLTLTLRQSVAPTPGQATKAPMVIPFAVGFLAADGSPLTLAQTDGTAHETHLLELTDAVQQFVFEGAPEGVVPSLLRGFSAPVRLEYARDSAELAFLLAHDTDPFNQWEAGRHLALGTLTPLAGGERDTPDPALADALDTALQRGGDPSLLSLMLALPSDQEVAAHLHDSGAAPDPDRIEAARVMTAESIARKAEKALRDAYAQNATSGPFSPDAESAGKRALRNAALGLLTRLGTDDTRALAAEHYRTATNMTDTAAALALLVRLGGAEATEALDAYAARWTGNGLMMDRWISVQVALAPGDAVAVAKTLRGRADIDWHNPNRFRALVGGFVSNHAQFHRADGAGYRFVAEQLAWLDGFNPQTTARMATAFETWKRYDDRRQAQAEAAIEGLYARPECSRDLHEMLKRILGQ